MIWKGQRENAYTKFDQNLANNIFDHISCRVNIKPSIPNKYADELNPTTVPEIYKIIESFEAAGIRQAAGQVILWKGKYSKNR